MIRIVENKATKIPGETSLYINFDYNAEIVNTLKSVATVKHYDSKTYTWEIPLTDLASFLDSVCYLDDVSLKLMEQKPKQELVQYNLGGYKTTPYRYQLDGINFGLNHNKWLLLDEPGLGKTLQMIYLAQELKARENIEHCLIVCGVNVLKFNWKREIEKHSNLSCRILGQKINSKGELRIGGTKERLDDLSKPIDEFFVITNIETLRDDKIIKEFTKKKRANNFDMIVVDECHKSKNPKSQQSKGLMKLKDAKYKVGLTGTIFTNSPMDLYIPLTWIGVESSTHSNFEYYYCLYGGDFGHDLLGYRNLEVLKTELENHSLRRTKDLIDLPPKTIINEYVDMDSTQRMFYDNIKQGIIDQVDKVHMSTANLLAMIARLRQATACPKILTTSSVPSAKLDRACDLVEQIVDNGNKVVIFSTFKETLNQLMIDLKQYKPLLNTGDIKDEELNENIYNFQNKADNKVFLATWQKMGTGITLTAASYAIFIDTPWTNADYEQTQDRIHRIGAKNPVFIYHLITKDTIDERVLEIVDDKEALGDYIVDDKITAKSINSLRKYIEELK